MYREWPQAGRGIEADNDDDDDGMNSGPTTTSEEGHNWNQEAEPHTDGRLVCRYPLPHPDDGGRGGRRFYCVAMRRLASRSERCLR